MKKLVFILSVVWLVTASCHKKHSSPQYVPGMVLVGLRGAAPMDTAFAIANRNSLTIQEIMGYTYVTPYPQDSMASLASYLDTKKYIDTFGEKAAVEKNVYGSIWVLAEYYYMDAAAQQDWLSALRQLQLTEWLPAGSAADNVKDMILLVPVGEEQYFANLIKQDPMVTWTELNYENQFQL